MSLPRCEQCFWLVVPRGKFATTNQKHYPDFGSDTSSVWSFCVRSPDVISRENQQWLCGMSAFFLGCFKSNHRHSELTNRNVALRAAHCNSRIWICRKKRYQRKEWEQRKKRFIFLAVSRRLPCAYDWKLFSARGAKRTVPSILLTLVGTVGIFSAPSMSVFASWHHRSKKINTKRKEHNFLSESWVQHGCPNLLWRELVLENLSLSQYENSV